MSITGNTSKNITASIDQTTSHANEVVTKTGSVTTATLSAETTKVIGTVNDKIADGDDVALGAKADAPIAVAATTAPNSLISLAKGIWNRLFGVLDVQVYGSIPAGANNIGDVDLASANFEQTLNTALPAKAVLQGMSDGTNIQAVCANREITLLASAARTATTSSANQINNNSRGVYILLNVTAASGTGGLTLRIVNGNDRAVDVAPTAVLANGNYLYLVYPGINETVTGTEITKATNKVLPRTWRITVLVGDASSYTYSVTASVLL